jgi:hypothetical protein
MQIHFVFLDIQKQLLCREKIHQERKNDKTFY